MRALLDPARWLVLFAVGALASLFGSVFIAGSALGMLGISNPRIGMVATSLMLCLALLALSQLLLRAQGATLSDLGLLPEPRRLRQLSLGMCIGTVLFLGIAGAQSAAVGASWKFAGIEGLRVATIGLAFTFVLVLAEELMFRGVALRELRVLFGDRVAVVLSAVLFGGYHLLQSDHWAMGAVFTFLIPSLGGVLFGWAAVRGQGLALPVGLHMGGNWVQSSLAGFAPVESASSSSVQALWQIPISVADVRTLTAPDVIPRLPYMIAFALAALLITRLVREHRSPVEFIEG